MYSTHLGSWEYIVLLAYLLLPGRSCSRCDSAAIGVQDVVCVSAIDVFHNMVGISAVAGIPVVACIPAVVPFYAFACIPAVCNYL
jgi:hypothetical protein